MESLGIWALGYFFWFLWRQGRSEGASTFERKPARASNVHDRLSFQEGADRALALLRCGDVEEGRLLARDLLAAAERLFGAETPEAATASDLILEALLLLRQDRDGEARQLSEQVLRVREAQFGREDPRLVQPLLKLARVAAANGEAAAPEFLRQAVALAERCGSEGGMPLAARIARIGLASLSWGLIDDARDLLTRALAGREDLTKDPKLLLETLVQLARIHIVDQRWPDARALLLEAVPLTESIHGTEHNRTGTIVFLLGATVFSLGEPFAAAELFRRSLSIQERCLGPSHLDVADTVLALARTMDWEEDGAAAHPLVERALTIRESALGKAHAALIEPLAILAGIDFARGEHGKCKQALERILNLQGRLGPVNAEIMTTLQNLSAVAEATGNQIEARRQIERALEIAEQAWGRGDSNLVSSLETLGRMQWQAGEVDACRATNERILAIYRRELGSRHPAVAGKLRELALVALRADDSAAAVERFAEALAVLEQASAGQGPLARQIVHDLQQILETAPHEEVLRILHRRARSLQQFRGGAPPMAEA